MTCPAAIAAGQSWRLDFPIAARLPQKLRLLFTSPSSLRHLVAGRQRYIVDYAKLANAWQDGDQEAGNELFTAVGSELRAIAAARLRQERHCSLSTGDLVNEAIIKLFRLNIMEIQGRAHILALASRLMRQILIDEARKRNRDKHHHVPVTLTTNVAEWEMPIELLSIDLVLEELAEIDPERAQLVEMRFFGGMSNADIATVLGVSEPTVKRRWVATRAWLRHRLDRP